jgi:hypothetical protein
MGARLGGDGALRADGRGGSGGSAGAGPLGEVYSKLGVPRARRICNRPLSSHSFLDCTAPIITLVRLHWSPLR